MWIIIFVFIVLFIVYTLINSNSIFIKKIGIERYAKGLGEQCTWNTDCDNKMVCCKEREREAKDSSGNVILGNNMKPVMEKYYQDKQYGTPDGKCSLPCISVGAWCDYDDRGVKRMCANRNDDENQDVNTIKNFNDTVNGIDTVLTNIQNKIYSTASTIENTLNNNVDKLLNSF